MKKLASLLIVLCLIFASACTANTPQTAPEIKTMTDRSGQEFTLPASVETIVSLAPSISEILFAIGAGDKIIAADSYSYTVTGINAAICVLDIYPPNAEAILAYEPDVVFVSGLSQVGDDNPFRMLKDAGICVVYIPSSASIEDIYGDIEFISAVVGKEAEGKAVIDEMKAAIAEIAAVGEKITDKKTVLFEVAASPFIYSFGSGTYLNEMIELIGGENVLADQSGWLAVSDESAVAANPDVIFTNIDYLDDPVGEILSRPAFRDVTAVANGDVFYIDTVCSGQPTHKIVVALRQMAKAVYPELYAFLGE